MSCTDDRLRVAVNCGSNIQSELKLNKVQYLFDLYIRTVNSISSK